MRTSKIIFISLLGTIALLILAAAIDIRINGVRRGDFRDNLKVNKQIIPSFSVLCLDNSKNVELVQGDSSHIVISSMKDSIPPKVNYTIKDDTLRLTDFDRRNLPNVWISIHVTNTMKDIHLKNSDLSIRNFQSRILSLNLNRSTVWMYQNKNGKYTLPVLNVIAKNHSRFDTGTFKVDSLGILLQNSRADIQIYAKTIGGTLSDSSKIYVRQPLEISLKRDSTSKINVSQN